MTEAAELDLVGLADAIKAGEVTAESACRATLDNLRTIGKSLNAVMCIDEEKALESARSVDLGRSAGKVLAPLAGVTLAHKDLFYRAGRVSAGGSLILREFKPDITATVLERLDAASAIDAGSLQMGEFALSPTGYNKHYGMSRNPWDTARVTGGSSSGSGAAIAARILPASLGTDTGGSVRLPAAMCGIVGLKPTQFLVSRYGIMPLSPNLDSAGPLARTARDIARMMSVIGGPDEHDSATALSPLVNYESALTGDIRGLRIAIPQSAEFEAIDAEIAEALTAAREILIDLGATLVATRPDEMTTVRGYHNVVLTVEAATWHREWIEQRPQDYSDNVRRRIEPGLRHLGIDYFEAICARDQVRRDWLAKALGHAQAALIPMLPIQVPTIKSAETEDPDEARKLIEACTRFTRGINYLGLPAASVPCGFDSLGLPIAFQLVGAPFTEGTLLRIADAYQSASHWHRRKPPVRAK